MTYTTIQQQIATTICGMVMLNVLWHIYKQKQIWTPHFFFQYTVDEESRLANLFSTDSQSHLDNACFGDVVAFDTTYKTNVYKKPLVILVGVNYHRHTIVFGFGLLVNETVETYTWVLQNILVAMNNKTPISVVIDGDKAMSKAIKMVIPESQHRLCV